MDTRVSKGKTTRVDTRVSRKTTRGWAKTDRGNQNIEWAESHRECRKTEWAQTQRVHIETKSAHKQSWQRHRRKTERGRSDTSQHSRVNRNNTSKQGRYKQSWHKYRADKDVSGCKHREWENNMRRSGTKEKIRHQRELLQQQQKRQATKSDRQHTRLHQRKYDLTFLKCLQSGIIRGTRSLHKLAEWSKSHRQCFLWRGCKWKTTFSTNSIEKPDWRNNLNWIQLPANQISETKLDNKIKIGLERNKIFLGLVFYYVWWKFSDMNL